jgi:hypothetical protein
VLELLELIKFFFLILLRIILILVGCINVKISPSQYLSLDGINGFLVLVKWG